MKIDPVIGNLLPKLCYQGVPGQTLELFVAGEKMMVETSYKAAYGFENPSQGDFDDLELSQSSEPLPEGKEEYDDAQEMVDSLMRNSSTQSS